MSDFVIRGATIVDGLGHEPRRADLAVKDGRIEAIGDIKGNGARTIDAGGLVLSPGIVDVHTHYDAQVTWDSTLSPSPSLGVTTVHTGHGPGAHDYPYWLDSWSKLLTAHGAVVDGGMSFPSQEALTRFIQHMASPVQAAALH